MFAPFQPVTITPRQKPHIYLVPGWVWIVKVPTYGALPRGSIQRAHKFVNCLNTRGYHGRKETGN